MRERIKTDILQKVRVEPDRLAYWKAQYAKYAKKHPDVSFTAWVRNAIQAYAERQD